MGRAAVTRDEFADVMESVRAWWPSAPNYRPATLDAWFEELRWREADDVREAWRSAFRDGLERPPTAGQVGRRLDERGQRAEYAGSPCTCYVDGLRGCRSQGHPKGWRERQRARDQACDIVEGARALGEEVSPFTYPGYLGQAVAAASLRQHVLRVVS